MMKRIKFTAIILVLIVSFAWPNLMAQADYQMPDIAIDYDVSTEVKAGQFVHLPGPVDLNGGGTSGRNGYGYVLMPTDLPDQTKLTVSEIHDVDFVRDTNGDNMMRCGEAYEFTVQIPDGTSYNESFSITLPYCNGLSDPDIYTHDENTDNWSRENGTFDYNFYDITTEISELTAHGVFSTEQIGGENEGEIEDVSEDVIDDEHEGEINNEIDDESEDEISDKNDIDDTTREDEMTLTINEELIVYADQTVLFENTGSQIIMPVDLPDETTIKVEDANDADFVMGADGLEVSGDVFTVTIMTPDGTNFEDSFTLTLAANEHAEAIYYYNENNKEWEKQGGKFNNDKSEITIETDHFSTYGVFGIDEKEEVAVENDDSTTTGEVAAGGNEVSDDNEEASGILPFTSTNLFNWVLFGAIFIVIGFAFIIVKRKSSSSEKE